MFKVPTKEISNVKRYGKVRQANALIRSRQPLDLMQKRLFYLILETIRTTDTQFSDVEFPVPVLKELLGGNYGSFYNDLFEASQGLVGTSFSVLRSTGSWVTTPIFDRIEYLKSGDTNDKGYTNENNYDVVRARLHDGLKTYLLKLERNYNAQDLIYVLTIPRVRSHRLYEILLHESWRGERPEFNIDLVQLQAFLGIEEEYKRWQDFKRTLKRQQNIVHEYTDLRFTFDGVRTGRSVTQVRFQVRFAKTQQGTLVNNEPQRAIEEIQLANELRDAGYQQDAYDAIQTYGTAKVRNALKQARAAQKTAHGSRSEIRNVGGFIHYLLQTQPDRGTDATTVTNVLSNKELTGLVDTLLENYEQQRDMVIEEALQEFDEDARDHLTAKIFDLLNPFEMALINDDSAAFTAIRNRYIVENELLGLPKRFRSAREFYRDTDFGHDAKTNEWIRNNL